MTEAGLRARRVESCGERGTVLTVQLAGVVVRCVVRRVVRRRPAARIIAAVRRARAALLVVAAHCQTRRVKSPRGRRAQSAAGLTDRPAHAARHRRVGCPRHGESTLRAPPLLKSWEGRLALWCRKRAPSRVDSRPPTRRVRREYRPSSSGAPWNGPYLLSNFKVRIVKP